HYPTTTGSYFRASSNSSEFGFYDFTINDRLVGASFSHFFYAMNDRLRIIPGYGFINYVEDLSFQANIFSSSQVTSPATVQWRNDRNYSGRSSVGSMFVALGFEYDWSTDIRIRGQLRWMPPSSGSFSVNNVGLGNSYDPTSGNNSLVYSFRDKSGSSIHSYLDLDLKLQYAIHDNIQVNAGIRYERIGSKYDSDPDYGFQGTIPSSSSLPSNALFLYDWELFTDPLIYRPRHRDLGTFYFSVTFRTARENI
ncbi:MAG: hypothetical protein KDK25_14880, partial [Leptospiraceae bacterium]|nr:hypothetical protein [Leptospiraceae bacterium]